MNSQTAFSKSLARGEVTDPDGVVAGVTDELFGDLDDLVVPVARPNALLVHLIEELCEVHVEALGDRSAGGDGSGRVARIAANAELTATGQIRIVIATVYRNNYLAGLSAVSSGAGRGEAWSRSCVSPNAG